MMNHVFHLYGEEATNWKKVLELKANHSMSIGDNINLTVRSVEGHTIIDVDVYFPGL